MKLDLTGNLLAPVLGSESSLLTEAFKFYRIL